MMLRDLKNIRKNIVKMAYYSHASHIGSALSVVDILYVIYKKIADINPSNVNSLDRDKVILSKGHASTALYAVLAHCGLLKNEYIDRYYVDGGVLPGHLDKDAVPGVDCSAGSLGHGAPIGIGMALANPTKNVYVIMGDGECNEGSVWEAFIFAGKHALPNLTFIIDKNNLQGFGRSDEFADYSKLSDTLKNFGFDVCEIDGHNLQEIEKAVAKKTNKTKAIIANTIKGKGVSFMEDEFIWHYRSPNDEEYAKAIEELSK